MDEIVWRVILFPLAMVLSIAGSGDGIEILAVKD